MPTSTTLFTDDGNWAVSVIAWDKPFVLYRTVGTVVRVYRLDVPGPWGSVGSTRSIGPWGSFGPWGSIGPWSTRGPWSGILPAIWIETPADDIRIRVEFRGGGKTATREAAAHHVASMRVEEHVLGLKLRIPIQAGAKEYVDVDYVESEVVVRIAKEELTGKVSTKRDQD